MQYFRSESWEHTLAARMQRYMLRHRGIGHLVHGRTETSNRFVAFSFMFQHNSRLWLLKLFGTCCAVAGVLIVLNALVIVVKLVFG